MRLTVAVTGMVLALGMSCASAAESSAREAYDNVPMPPGFKVVASELEGPVFADSRGRTLYKWPIASLRNGYAGDPKDKSACEDKVTVKTGGYMSPYPGGLDLPDLETRKSCVALWPPVVADAKAKPVGDWSIVKRSDGTLQWAYDHQPLYTSHLDQAPGDTLGGTGLFRRGGDTPAERMPVGPPTAMPPGFRVEGTINGRLLVNDKRYSVYVSDQDGPNKSNCTTDICLQRWLPVLAPETAQPQGEWSVIERSPGVRQWVFRKQPLYTYNRDTRVMSYDGGDEPGWHNVYAQPGPRHPKSFNVQNTTYGDVLADRNGKTVYFYTCGDDSADQLSCDTLDSPQQYRLAICGGGDWARCHELWHFVPAAAGEKSDSRVWSIISVDPKTDRQVSAGQAGSVRVWAFRGRPVYTYSGDKQAGEFRGHSMGEWQGRRNGFRAFWIRVI
jgi:predicted lipoprotein with Yx(FWY)xxD motif